MKKCLFLIVLFTTSFSFSQIDFGKQIKKKDLPNVTFEKTTDAEGNVTFGFKMNGLPVGGQMVLGTAGITKYMTFNKKHEIDGTMIIMKKNSGEIELYTYRKSQKNGPAFKMNGGNIAWHKQFEDDAATEKEYEVNHTFDYYSNKNTPSFEGFTIEEYKTSIAIGYFAYSKMAYPIIRVWNEGGSYYGQCIQGERKEFGAYFFADGKKYIGAWHKNDQEGLGFMIDKDGKVIEKGFYKDGKLEISI